MEYTNYNEGNDSDKNASDINVGGDGVSHFQVEVICEDSNLEPKASAAKFWPDQIFASVLLAHMICRNRY